MVKEEKIFIIDVAEQEMEITEEEALTLYNELHVFFKDKIKKGNPKHIYMEELWPWQPLPNVSCNED